MKNEKQYKKVYVPHNEPMTNEHTQQIKKDFEIVKMYDNIIYIDIETDGKVKKLERLKDYLNTHTHLYTLSIVFGGGDSLNNYTTLARIEIVEGLPF